MFTLNISSDFVSLRKKLEYVIDIFETIYSVNTEMNICYGVEDKEGICIIPGTALQFFQKTRPIPENIEWLKWRDKDLPGFFSTDPISGPIQSNNGQIVINFDILGAAFYLLSCWQEWFDEESDELGRFPARKSFLYQNNLLTVPVVNYYFDILAEAVYMQTGLRPAVNIESKYSWSAIITHDIDQCNTGWRENSYRALVDGHLIKGLTTIIKRIINKDIWFNFNEIMNLEESLNVVSSFYFIAEQKKKGNYLNADYDIQSSDMKKVIRNIQDRGHEVGIHGSLGTGWNEQQLRTELSKFSKIPAGGRFHFLDMRPSVSFDIIDSIGLKYDSSLGFAEHIGFRNGFCYPYTPYNIRDDTIYNFVEFPLMVMDRTFVNSNYMGIDKKESLKHIYELIDEIEYFHGIFGLLWHNKFFSGYKFGDWKDVFIRIIEEIRNRGGEILLPTAIYNQYQIDKP